MKHRVCMIVQDRQVKGGIAAVIDGYYGSSIEKQYDMQYVESYCDGGKVKKLGKGIKGYFSFAKILLLSRPDIVHIHSSFGPSFYRKLPFIIAAHISGTKIVNHIHGADFDVFYRNASKRKKELIKKIYSMCHIVIALSDEWKEKLSEIVDVDRIRVIENYSMINYQACQARKNRQCNNQVLFLGELGKRKGCYDIPSVIKRVSQSVPNVKFILCGSGSTVDTTEIDKLISQLNVKSNVEFPGWVRGEQKSAILEAADVFFLPSYNEGMPMSILDAMGYGLPIVSTNIGGIPKIVHNGDNGACLNPGDVTGFTKEIIRLLKDDIYREEASSASLRIVEEGYSLDAHLSKLLSVYKELIV